LIIYVKSIMLLNIYSW